MLRISETALSQYGVTPDMILAGEEVEFDPVPMKEVNRKKGSYVNHEFALKLVQAYSDDLIEAYRVIDSMEQELSGVSANLAQTEQQTKDAAGKLNQMVAADAMIAESEKQLASLTEQLSRFMEARKHDKEALTALKNELAAAKEELGAAAKKTNADAQTIQTLNEQIEVLTQGQKTSEAELKNLQEEVNGALQMLKDNIAAYGMIID